MMTRLLARELRFLLQTLISLILTGVLIAPAISLAAVGCVELSSSDVTATLLPPTTSATGDSLISSVQLTNTSDFHIPNIVVGLVFYRSGEDGNPDYLALVDAPTEMGPLYEQLLPVSVDVSRLPVGEYQVHTVVAQGDVWDLLVAANMSSRSGQVFSKSVAALSDVAVSVEANDQLVSSGERVSVVGREGVSYQIETVNQSDAVVVGTKLHYAIAAADIPYSPSLIEVGEVNLGLIPGASNVRSYEQEQSTPSLYSVYTYVSAPDVARAVSVSEIAVGGEEAFAPVRYQSIVGTKAEAGQTRVAACTIESLGATGVNEAKITVVDNETGELEEQIVGTEDTVGASASFLLPAHPESHDLMVSFSVRETRLAETEEGGVELREYFVPVDAVQLVQTCDDAECIERNTEAIVVEEEPMDLVVPLLVLLLLIAAIGVVVIVRMHKHDMEDDEAVPPIPGSKQDDLLG